MIEINEENAMREWNYFIYPTALLLFNFSCVAQRIRPAILIIKVRGVITGFDHSKAEDFCHKGTKQFSL
jgi:hypothetical protein